MDVTSLVLKIADVAPNGAAMVCTLQRDLDPLDLEIVERALQGVWEGIAAGLAPLYLEIDEELERALRRELAETVRASGVTDAEALLDILFEGRGEIGWCALGVISQPVRALEGCYVVRASADARNPRVSTERAEHRLHRHILHELRHDAGKTIGPVHTHCIRNACEASAVVCHH